MLQKLFRLMLSVPGFEQYLAQHGICKLDDGDQITWSVSNSPRRHHAGGGGHGGGGGGISGWLVTLIIVMFLAYIALSLISTFAPTIGNLTYEGGGIGSTIFGLVQTWILPLALIGLLIYVVMHFLKGRGRS